LENNEFATSTVQDLQVAAVRSKDLILTRPWSRHLFVMQYTDVLITVVMSNLDPNLVIDMVLLIDAGS